jgi:hypothetical protein
MPLPSSDFEYPPLVLPMSGLEQSEMDLGDSFMANALTTNEQGGKLQGLLRYIEGFFETSILAGDGKKYLILAKEEGSEPIEPVTPPYTIYYGDGNVTDATYEYDVMLEDYDPDGDKKHTDWSVEFEVVEGKMTGNVSFSAEIERFPDDGADPPIQTMYRLPLIRSLERVSTGGLFQQDSMCVSGTPVVGLIKVG